jgi:hypothetical protein
MNFPAGWGSRDIFFRIAVPMAGVQCRALALERDIVMSITSIQRVPWMSGSSADGHFWPNLHNETDGLQQESACHAFFLVFNLQKCST